MQEDGEEGYIGERDGDTVEHTGSVRSKVLDVVRTGIPQRCKSYEGTVSTAPTHDFIPMSRMPM